MFSLKLVHAGFVLVKEAMEQVFLLPSLRLSLINIIATVLNIYSRIIRERGLDNKPVGGPIIQ